MNDPLAGIDEVLRYWTSFSRRVLAGDHPQLCFPGIFPCDLMVGDEFVLKTIGRGALRAPQVWIVVTGRRRGSRGEHLIDYSVRDDRPRFMHKDSSRGYTRNATDALDPDANAPEPEVQEKFTVEAWERYALRQPELEERLRAVRAEAKAKGIDSSRLDLSIERRIKAYERRVRAG